MVALSLLDCDEWRTETYLYDGDRRIAERWRDPIISNNGGGANGFQQQAATHTLWTEREYVYTPGYIDEFVGEIDANGSLWPILQDANQNAVAMLDDVGAIVRQRILSPYGRVISSEKPTVVAPPKSRIGHQGLFADRLNAPTTFDPLDANSHTIWHNRNRTLLPELGRFAQRDPNATGQGASSMLDMHGSALHDGVSPPDPAALFGDGQNIYAYAVASPTQHRDPSGLVIGFLVPGPSDFITGALEGMVNEYANRLNQDVAWATDWDLGDDWHSRGDGDWVQTAMLQGVYDAFHFGVPGTDIGFNPLHLLAGRKAKHTWEDHHFFPKAFWKKFRRIKGMTDTDLAMTERIFWDWHKRVHGKSTGHKGSWNHRWKVLFQTHKTLTREQAFRYMRRLQREFGFSD